MRQLLLLKGMKYMQFTVKIPGMVSLKFKETISTSFGQNYYSTGLI